MNFYNRFIELCNLKRKKPADVSREIGITKSSISNWKTRNGNPTDANLQKLSEYFGVTVEYLRGEQKKCSPAINADEPMYSLWNKYLSLSASDKKTIDDMFDFLLSKPEYEKKDNVG